MWKRVLSGCGGLWKSRVADQLRPKLPKLAAFLDEAETDVLAYMTGSRRRSPWPTCIGSASPPQLPAVE